VIVDPGTTRAGRAARDHVLNAKRRKKIARVDSWGKRVEIDRMSDRESRGRTKQHRYDDKKNVS
jgi:hypothetical protein